MGDLIYMDEHRSSEGADKAPSFFDNNMLFLLAGGAVIIGVFLAYLLATSNSVERPVIE